MGSILTDIKSLLGIDEDFTKFDPEITLNINSVLMILNQLGLGPEAGFSIKNKDATWSQFIGDRKDLEGIKTYIYLKVRLTFDPPQMGYLVESIEKQCREFEWRLNLQAEGVTTNEG